MSIKLALGLGLPAAFLATVIGSGILVVNVEHGGPDGHHVVVPVPLILARAVAAVLPGDKGRIECPELVKHREEVLRAVRALRAAPDAELVRVEQPGETVLIRKVNGMFEVQVDEKAEQVLVRVPAAAVEEVLASYDGKAFHLTDLAAATRHLPLGDVVRVTSKDERVRISVW